MSKSITRIISEGTFWTSLGNFALKGVGFATLFIVLRNLSVYEYGLVELVISIVPIFGVFLLPGLSNVVITDMSVEKGKGNLSRMKGLFLNFFFLQFVLSFVAWAVIFFGANIIASFYEGQVVTLLKIISFSFLISPFRTMVVVIFQVNFKFFHMAVYKLFEEASKLLMIFVFVATLQKGPLGVVLATVLCEYIIFLLMLPLFWHTYSQLSSVRADNTISPLSLVRFHGKWGVFSTYLNQFGQNIRLWIIKFTLGTEAVGLFAVAHGLLQHTTSLLPLNRVLTPIIPQFFHQKERFYKIVSKGIKYQLLGYSILGVVAFFVFPPIIVWLFPHYEASMPLFKVMLLVLIPISFSVIFTPTFYALKAQKSLFFAVILRIIFIIILAPIFMSVFGIMGIAYEFILTYVFFVLERYRVLKKMLPGFKFDLRSVFTIDKDDRIIWNKILSVVGIGK